MTETTEKEKEPEKFGSIDDVLVIEDMAHVFVETCSNRWLTNDEIIDKILIGIFKTDTLLQNRKIILKELPDIAEHIINYRRTSRNLEFACRNVRSLISRSVHVSQSKKTPSFGVTWG